MVTLLLLKVTLAGVIGLLVIAALPKASAALRHALAVLFLVAMAIIPLVAWSRVEWRLPVLRAAAPMETYDEPAPARPSVNPAMTAASPAPVRSRSAMDLVLIGYAAIVALAIGRLLLGIAAVRRIVNTAEPIGSSGARADIRITDRVKVPMMTGIVRPVLLLPRAAEEWAADRLRVVMLHELAHVERHDVATLLLTRVVSAIYWFHPAAWLLERIARRECERACDDVVLAAGARASEYADHLLAIARSLPPRDALAGVTLAISRRSELEGRLLAILEGSLRRAPVSRRAVTALFVTMAVIVVPLASVRLVAEQVQPHVGVKLGVKYGTKRSIAGGVEGGVPGGVNGGVQGGVKGGVEGGVNGGVLGAADEFAQSGRAFLRERRLDDAIEALTNSIRANPYGSSARYNLACAYALRGDRNLALNALRDAVVYGYSDAEHMRNDDDLASLRGRELDDVADLAEELVIAQNGDDWRDAIPRYERVAREHPDIPRASFNLGFVLLGAGEDRRAIEVLNGVLLTGYRSGTTMYNIACGYAHLRERETALQWLRRAQVEGFDVGGHAKGDPDLDNVRNDPWLASLIASRDRGDFKLKDKHKEKE